MILKILASSKLKKVRITYVLVNFLSVCPLPTTCTPKKIHRHCRLWRHRHLLCHKCPCGKHRPCSTEGHSRHSIGETQQYEVTGNLALPHLPSGFPIKGHLMPGFRHNLIGVGPLYDSDCSVTFTREAITIRDKQGTALLTGWREATGPRLWRIALQPG